MAREGESVCRLYCVYVVFVCLFVLTQSLGSHDSPFALQDHLPIINE